MDKHIIKTTKKVIPMCYAYTTPGVIYHEGWTKIGYTERDVDTRIKEQTQTANIKYNISVKGSDNMTQADILNKEIEANNGIITTKHIIDIGTIVHLHVTNLILVFATPLLFGDLCLAYFCRTGIKTRNEIITHACKYEGKDNYPED